MPLEVKRLRTYANFKVIDIADDTNPYLALLGSDWEIDNQTIINFNNLMILSFEYSELRVVELIDLLEGQRYVEPIKNEGQGNYLDQFYNIMYSREDYINPITNRKLSWQSVISCTYYLGDALKNW